MLTNKTLFEVEQGAGEPLILIHGSTSDYRTWQVSQEELSKSFRTISYSRCYHWPNANFISAEFLGSGFPALRAAELRTLQIPTLLIGGERSPKLFSLLLDALEEMLPRAERVQIPRASHIVHEDNPAAFNEALIAFLAKQRIE